MTITIPAAGLIATGLCTGACLLALDDECDCRCAGRYHSALTDASVPVDPNWQAVRAVPANAPARTLLGDVLGAVGDAERMHSNRLCARLSEQWPEDYPDWTPAMLARALLEVGVRTRQICERTGDGGQANRRGVYRADLAAAIKKARKAAS